ncbi:hypothetical protein MIMGU_mgv11b0011952mg, partial [Erythranthe guttata]
MNLILYSKLYTFHTRAQKNKFHPKKFP